MNKIYQSHLWKRQALMFSLNLIIFLVIFIALSTIQLAVSRNAIIKDIDENLRKDAFNLVNEEMLLDVLQCRNYPKIKIAYYDASGQLIRNKGNNYDIQNEILTVGEQGFQSFENTKNKYRSFTRPVNIDNAKYLKVVRNIDDLLYSERVVSQTSFNVMAIGIAVGFVVSLLLSFLQILPMRKVLKNNVQFTNDVSHEINTPLAVIKNNVEELLRHPTSSVGETVDNIVVAINEINHLQKLSCDLLQLSRSDRRMITCKYESINIKVMLASILEMYEMLAVSQNKSFSFDIIDTNFVTDTNHFTRLCIIALDNAFKYTTEGESIAIKIFYGYTRKGRRLNIEVSDTGKGVAREEMRRIFQRFYRSDESRSEKEGTGLGLAIASALTSEMKGQIIVSENTPRGFVITFSLPIKKAVS